MRKKNKKNMAFTILTTCMLILAACGKSEEEKAADEIYSHLDAEEQANVDKDREEIANYEAEKEAEAEAFEAAKEVNYMDVLTEWELGKDMQRCPNPLGYGSIVTNEDFSNLVSILYPDEEYVDCDEYQPGLYFVGLQSSGYVLCSYYFAIEGKQKNIDLEDEIGNYTVSSYSQGAFGTEISIYDKALDKSMVINIITRGDNNEELVSKNYDFIVEQVKSWEQSEATDTAETDESEKSVQGEKPYGVYECESGAEAWISSFQNEVDVIEFYLKDEQSVSLMTDFEWVEGKTYNLTLSDTLAIATFDESGNMQITALSDEAKPYEGYYTKTE